MEVPENEQVQPTEDLINEALKHRAELVESRIQLNSQELSNKAIRSSPQADAGRFRYYGGSGAGGNQSDYSNCDNPNSIPGLCTPAGTIAPTVSYNGTLNQLVNSTAPDKGAGLQLNIPLRNRAAQAIQIRGELEYRQEQMALQQTENRVSIEVRQAQFSVEQNQASVAAAKAAMDYAASRLTLNKRSISSERQPPPPCCKPAAHWRRRNRLSCLRWPPTKKRVLNSTARWARCSTTMASALMMPPGAMSRGCRTCLMWRRGRTCPAPQPSSDARVGADAFVRSASVAS